MKNLDNLSAEEIGKLFPVRIVPYDSEWKILFEQEKKLLIEILGIETVLNIEHIGSTSIPGLASKPTIDILVEVLNLSDELKQLIIQKLKTIGYENMNNAEKENKMTFGKGYDENYCCTHSYHLHIRKKGILPQDEIYFRNYLRENSYVRNEYEKLKRKLAEKYQFNREDYTCEKTEFVMQITKLSKKYKNEQ